IVLDEDTYRGGDCHELEKTYTPLPSTVEQLTGGGGRQLFFLHPGIHIPNSTRTLGHALDIPGDGGYGIAPPSLHRSGQRYLWEVQHEPPEQDVASMPPWLQALCTTARPHNALDPGAILGEGERNDQLFRMGCSMRARGFSEAAIYGALSAI